MKVTIVPNDDFDDKTRTVKAFRIHRLMQELAEKRELLDNLIIRFKEQNNLTYRQTAALLDVDKMVIFRVIQRRATGQTGIRQL